MKTLSSLLTKKENPEDQKLLERSSSNVDYSQRSDSAPREAAALNQIIIDGRGIQEGYGLTQLPDDLQALLYSFLSWEDFNDFSKNHQILNAEDMVPRIEASLDSNYEVKRQWLQSKINGLDTNLRELREIKNNSRELPMSTDSSKCLNIILMCSSLALGITLLATKNSEELGSQGIAGILFISIFGLSAACGAFKAGLSCCRCIMECCIQCITCNCQDEGEEPESDMRDMLCDIVGCFYYLYSVAIPCSQARQTYTDALSRETEILVRKTDAQDKLKEATSRLPENSIFNTGVDRSISNFSLNTENGTEPGCEEIKQDEEGRYHRP